MQINDKNIDDVQYLEPYTLYINPYYVVTELQGGDKVSKHYYMNTQRVATDISINYQAQESMAGPQQPNARDPKKPSEDTASVNYNAAFADLQATLTALGHQKLDVNGLGQQPTLEQYYPELVRETAFNTTAAKNAPESTTRVLFWYHPDYIGNVDLVTERDGKTYEFFTYNPWGEEMHQYNANTFSFSSPYRFNAKEKDSETGLHYYGARYYQSKLSMWLSVDPLAHETLEPYVFTGNNPVMMIDPDGRDIVIVGSKEFRLKVEATMATLALTSETGYELLVGALKSERTLVIYEGSSNEVSGFQGSNYEVLGYSFEEACEAKDGAQGSAEATLAHEIEHFNTVLEKGSSISKSKDGYSIPGVSAEEVVALESENSVRKEMGIDERLTYSGEEFYGKQLAPNEKYSGYYLGNNDNYAPTLNGVHSINKRHSVVDKFINSATKENPQTYYKNGRYIKAKNSNEQYRYEL